MKMQEQLQPETISSTQLVCEILRFNQNSQFDDESMKMYCEDDNDKTTMQSSTRTEKIRNTGEVILLDCQNPSDYHEGHIRGSINVTFPTIMVRRIQTGKIDLFDKSKELKEKMSKEKITFVVYDTGNTGAIPTNNGTSIEPLSEIVALVAKKLVQHGCHVFTLTGGLYEFRESYPEWVESNELKKIGGASNRFSSSSSSSNNSPGGPFSIEGNEVPLLGLGSLASLRIQDEGDTCDSSIGLDLEDTFPVEIIPNLYLGNAVISRDKNALDRHNIKHILNVTPDLPNVFTETIRYLQIPISDHWTQSLFNYFPAAITFIDEGRSKDEGVLVHCLAGISRSVTITMAYIMFKMGLSLNEAYDIVRSRKSNISPNFHFMGQLLDFERQLHSQFLSPATIGSSPDSGIEFDRWNTN